MKRIAFAHLKIVYDFDTKEECDKYIKRIDGKYKYRAYNNGDFWSCIVYKPYRNYEMGF